MQLFETFTLWTAFERLHGLETSKLGLALSARIIADRSNVVSTCVTFLPVFRPFALHRRLFIDWDPFWVLVILWNPSVYLTDGVTLRRMIYQANYVPGRLNNTSKVLVTMVLLIVTFNRLQYQGQSIIELQARVQRTGPFVPTLRYVVSEVLLAVLLVLEGFKAGGAAGGTVVLLLFITLLVLGSILSIRQA
ncbi:hypothetical protein DL96DRAFT_1711517 [Flagelloscypha sp. PMI_526]|nr:hypothetical protein DL96DRAFT_1711517 [Flagelloscypha sp. PMI_526]